jgi:hypothetical protein
MTNKKKKDYASAKEQKQGTEKACFQLEKTYSKKLLLCNLVHTYRGDILNLQQYQ